MVAHSGAGGVWEAGDLAQVLWALRAPLPPGAAGTSDISPGLFVDIGANVSDGWTDSRGDR